MESQQQSWWSRCWPGTKCWTASGMVCLFHKASVYRHHTFSIYFLFLNAGWQLSSHSKDVVVFCSRRLIDSFVMSCFPLASPLNEAGIAISLRDRFWGNKGCLLSLVLLTLFGICFLWSRSLRLMSGSWFQILPSSGWSLLWMIAPASDFPFFLYLGKAVSWDWDSEQLERLNFSSGQDHSCLLAYFHDCISRGAPFYCATTFPASCHAYPFLSYFL